jgi:hypothetical protein
MRIMRAAVIAAALVCLSSAPGFAAGAHNPGIIPINARAFGTTYAELAAAWWQWVLGAHVADSELLDPTGEKCAVGQTGHVWFLAETFFGGTAHRTCAVPRGTALFVPMANALYGAFLNDPAEQRTVDFARAHTICVLGADIHAEIDGVPLKDPRQYLEESLFVAHLSDDNLFGLTADVAPELVLDPTADRGYYLFIEPLPPGRHTIHLVSSATEGLCVLDQDVTYDLSVGK